MRPIDVHEIDQFLAFALDIQVRLREHKRRLIKAGWSEEEAWALCLLVEERMLGPYVDIPGEDE